jgi:hypothetical protein
MGCCFSCNDDDDNQSIENGIRQPLIDPVSNATPVVRVPHTDEPVQHSAAIQSVKVQEDELAKILQETASAMIDVSGSGSHSLDQREFQERSKHYLQKIQNLSPGLLQTPIHLLGDVPNPDKHLGAPLISQEDLDLMNWAMDEVEMAMHSIRVEHNEDLVVPFGGHHTAIGAGD